VVVQVVEDPQKSFVEGMFRDTFHSRWIWRQVALELFTNLGEVFSKSQAEADRVVPESEPVVGVGRLVEVDAELVVDLLEAAGFA